MVITRKFQEKVVIGDSIVVTALGAKGERARIGTEAPPDVRIWRKELGGPLEEKELVASGGMLVLSRKPGEEILMTGGISVLLIEVDRNKIRLGIVAPPEIGIWRLEVLPKEHPLYASLIGPADPPAAT